ncbi:MAG: CCA tRNA nucleotidyltransferase [Planctomycetes bacterium]|nr:CCA tRNA nucleotidyltransferase [Planctomycetota bacterium]
MSQASDKTTAMWVLRRLRSAGFEALFAGGCVRDMLMARPCSDYDIATSATPQDVRKLFPHVLLVGAQFGVAMVIRNRRKVEVATFRSDLSYSDGRRPDGVKFSTAREDALRRDFTINGMFYDPVARQVIDYVGGRDDLRAGVIRTIGRPQERFSEDYLRLIRAVRFAVRLDFKMEEQTAAAIRKFAPKISAVSGERIFEELSKMLALPSAADAMAMLRETGLAEHVLPELFSMAPVASGAGETAGAWAAAAGRLALTARRRDAILNFAAMLCGLDARTIGRIVRRWGASNDIKDALIWIAENRGRWQTAADEPLCEFKRLLADENFGRLRAIWAAEEKTRTGRGAKARLIARRIAAIPQDEIAPPPLITGADLIEMGLTEGPRLGKILRRLYDAQLNGEISTRRQATERAKSLIEAK